MDLDDCCGFDFAFPSLYIPDTSHYFVRYFTLGACTYISYVHGDHRTHIRIMHDFAMDSVRFKFMSNQILRKCPGCTFGSTCSNILTSRNASVALPSFSRAWARLNNAFGSLGVIASATYQKIDNNETIQKELSKRSDCL